MSYYIYKHFCLNIKAYGSSAKAQGEFIHNNTIKNVAIKSELFVHALSILFIYKEYIRPANAQGELVYILQLY